MKSAATTLAAAGGLLLVFAGTAQAEPLFGTCISCSFFETYDRAMSNYAQLLYDGTNTSAKKMLNAASYLWLVWVVILYQIDKAPPYKELVPQFLALFMAGAALNGFDYWKEYALTPIMGTAIDWALYIARLTGADTGGKDGFSALIYAAETPPYAIIKPTLSMWDDLAENIARLLISAVLIVIWVGVWFRIEGTLIIAYTRFLAITCVAPFLIVCAVFPISRPIFKGGLKELLHGALDLVFMAVYIGLVNFIMKQMSQYFPATVEGGWVIDKSSKWLFSADFWNLVFTGSTFLAIHLYLRTLPSMILVTLGIHMQSPQQQTIQQIQNILKGK